MTDAPALDVSGLTKTYGLVAALRGMTFAAPRGEITAVLGPNGAGKTTTLETCEGYRTADSGEVRVLGLDPTRDARELRTRVGVQLQSGGIPPGASAADALGHVSRLYANPLNVEALSQRLGIDTLGRTGFRRLSGGQQRLVTLGLALVGRPELVILDEPTSGLDPQARLRVWELLAELRDSGVSVVLSTHQFDEAERLADHVVIVSEGRCAAQGSLASVAGQPSVTVVTAGSADVADLSDLTHDLPGCQLVAVGPGRWSLTGDIGPATVAAVAAWCAARDIEVRDVALRSASLEEAYLRYTVTEAPTATGGDS